MKHPLALALAIALTTSVAACAQSDANPQADTAVTADASNPFFTESQLPLHYPRFDQIKDSHFGPAFDRGMAEHLKEVEAIANNPEPATFENTILPLEESGDILSRTASVFFSLVGADTNDARKALQAEYAPKLSAHSDAVSLNPKLFERIEALYEKRNELGLDAQGVRLVERYHTTFSQNVLAEVNDSAIVVDSVEQLAGLSDQAITAAAEAAKARGLDGKYVIALQNTTGQPPNTYLEDRALRERLHKASVARGSRANKWDNTGIVSDVVKLRIEKAKMLGYPTYAAYVLAK